MKLRYRILQVICIAALFVAVIVVSLIVREWVDSVREQIQLSANVVTQNCEHI